MKLKYIFTLLGVMLLGLTSCGKKDAPETNPFVGTQWERTTTETNEHKYTEVDTEEIHFVDDNHITFQSSHKLIAEDGTVKQDEKEPVSKTTYMHKGLTATSFNTLVVNGKEYNVKIILTMDEAKQKLTVVASAEGEKDQTVTFTRKK